MKKLQNLIGGLFVVLIVIGIPYLVVFLLDIGLNKFSPLGLVFGSVLYLIIGTFAVTILASIFSSIEQRLKNLELYQGKKRYWKEIIIYYLIAFTAITAYLSKSIVEFLSAMLIAGLATQLIVFIKDLIKRFNKNKKKKDE